MPPEKITADDLIEIPTDEIALGVDADGLPKTIPGGKVAAAEAEESEEAGDKKETARLTAIQTERDELRSERDRLAAEAAAEKAARLAAVQERDTLGSRLEKVTGQGVEAHRAAVRERYQRTLTEAEHVKSGIAQAKSMLEQARADLRAAHAAGDGDRITDLTDHLAAVRGHLNQLEASAPSVESYVSQYKAEYEHTERAIAEAEQTRAKAPEPEKKQQSIDDWIAASPTATQGWLGKNKSLLQDQKGFDKVNTFARLYALDHGDHALNTKAFAEALEAKFNPKAKDDEDVTVATDDDDTEAEVEAPKPKKRVTAAAPVSRGNTFSSSNMNARAVKLPPKLAAFVKASGLDPTQYALSAVADIKAGKLPKNFLDPDYDHQF